MRHEEEHATQLDTCTMFLLCSHSTERQCRRTIMSFERILNEIAAVTALFAGAYVLLMVV